MKKNLCLWAHTWQTGTQGDMVVKFEDCISAHNTVEQSGE